MRIVWIGLICGLYASCVWADLSLELQSGAYYFRTSNPTAGMKKVSVTSESEEGMGFDMGFEYHTVGEPYSEPPAHSIKVLSQSTTSFLNQMVGKPLIFPNPFRWNSGARIGYRLTNDMDVTVEIYNFAGYKVFSKPLKAGTEQGALKDYNRIPVNESVLGCPLPAGVYVYFILHEGVVLGKDKMVIMP